MFFRNKLILSIVLSMSLILGACGAKDTNDTNSNNNNKDVDSEDMSAAEREATIDTPERLPISDAFEEHSIWFTTDSLERQSTINELYVFENGEVTIYNNLDSAEESSYNLTIEEFNELSDEEVIQRAKDSTTTQDFGTSISSGEYTFDQTMDNVGQSVEYINVHLNNYIIKKIWDFESIQEEMEELTQDGYTYDRSASEEDQLEKYKAYSSDPDRPAELVDDPNGTLFVETIEEESTDEPILVLKDPPVYQEIFDTVYAGVTNADELLVTRVDNNSIQFEIDSPDTKK